MHMSTPDDDLDRRCREVTGRLLARYRWSLLDHEEFARRSIAAAREHPAADLAYIAFGVYNQVLYDTCSGSEGPFRWEQGYQELYEMLCDRAHHRYPDVWEDAVQSAIELTCKRFDRCTVPQAFFQFAWGHLQNAVRSLRPDQRRRGRRPDLSLERTVGDDNLSLAESLPDPSSPIAEQSLAEERRNELRAILDEIGRAHHRLRNQLAAVRMKYLEGKDDATISEVLGVSVEDAYVLRSRGLKKLRQDPRLRRLLDDEND
jgi:RNA polymerase sigma factor (sigma-70 family)